jgi:hypothetical protein
MQSCILIFRRLVLTLAASSAVIGCGHHESRSSSSEPQIVEECATYDIAYRACGQKLGATGNAFVAQNAERLRSTIASAASEGEVSRARMRRACAEATRQMQAACR